MTAPMTIGFDTPSMCMLTAPLLVGNALVEVLDTELEDAVELPWNDELTNDEGTGWPLFPTPCECECEPLCETLRSGQCLAVGVSGNDAPRGNDEGVTREGRRRYRLRVVVAAMGRSEGGQGDCGTSDGCHLNNRGVADG